MKTINTLNIFEASYYLSNSGNSLKDAVLTKGGFINYTLLCTDEVTKMKAEFAGGLANVNLQCYLWKFQDLYKKSITLQENESFLTKATAPVITSAGQGGAL